MTTTLTAPETTGVDASPPPAPKRSKRVDDTPAPQALTLTIAQPTLKAALDVVTRAAGGERAVMPALRHVRLTADADGLELACTNLDVTLVARIPASAATVETPGAFTVPASLFAGYVATLPATGIVRLALDPAANALRVTCGSAKSSIKGTDAADFPPPPQPAGAPLLEAAPATLRMALALGGLATAADAIARPALHCVHLVGADGALTAESADGYRLSALRHEAPGIPAFDVLLPQEGADAAERLLDAAGEVAAYLWLLPNQERPNQLALRVTTEARTVTLVAKLGEGQFPALERVIPIDPPLRVTVGRAALAAAVRQALLFSQVSQKEKFSWHVLRFRIAGEGDTGTLTVSATEAERGEGTSEIGATVHGDVTGRDLIGLAGEYVGAVLAALPGDDVTLGLDGAMAPVLVTTDALPEYRHVIMPMDLGAGGRA